MNGSGRAPKPAVKTPAAGAMLGVSASWSASSKSFFSTSFRRDDRRAPRRPASLRPESAESAGFTGTAVRPPTPPVPGSRTADSPATIDRRRVRSSKSASIFSIDSRRVFVRAARDLRSEFSARRAVTSLFLRIERTHRTEKVMPRTTARPKETPRPQRSREEMRNCRKRALAWGTKMMVCSRLGIRSLPTNTRTALHPR